MPDWELSVLYYRVMWKRFWKVYVKRWAVRVAIAQMKGMK